MTLLLAHPEAEDLARFVEGTLEDPERAAIVDHIADCDDCRTLVVDAAEFVEPAKTASHSNWWMGIAAALIVVASLGPLGYYQFHDPLAKVEKDYAKVQRRPVEGRLSGFPYVERRTNRGQGEETDLYLDIMKGDAADAMETAGSSARSLHTRGIGLLLAADNPKESIPTLEAAASRDPKNDKYQNDLATALIAAAGGNNKAMLQRAVAACDRALQINPRSLDALFNRAIALYDIDHQAAIAAFKRYLEADSASPWATEARTKLEILQEPP